jgi:phage gp36-like protein
MPYLTINEYVDRFGEAETVRVTDESRTGSRDDEKVETAITDATNFADSYLGTRYTVPIADPPEILKGIVAALAREQLHRTRPTPAVTENADRARAQLKDLSRGLAVLPIADGQEEPAQVDTGKSATSGDGRPRVFADTALQEYLGFGPSSGCGRAFPGPRGY